MHRRMWMITYPLDPKKEALPQASVNSSIAPSQYVIPTMPHASPPSKPRTVHLLNQIKAFTTASYFGIMTMLPTQHTLKLKDALSTLSPVKTGSRAAASITPNYPFFIAAARVTCVT